MSFRRRLPLLLCDVASSRAEPRPLTSGRRDDRRIKASRSARYRVAYASADDAEAACGAVAAVVSAAVTAAVGPALTTDVVTINSVNTSNTVDTARRRSRKRRGSRS